VLAPLFRLAWLWSAYWRLYPLWDALRQVIPEIQLPPEPGLRWNIRYRLHRRVIEIRDAELVLRPYATAEVAGQAAATARSSGLRPDRADAVVSHPPEPWDGLRTGMADMSAVRDTCT
jgi:hypothetical protein